MSTFRLATINVHSFCSATKYESNISQLVEILEPLHLDLIALQEIQNNEDWKTFCSDLSLHHSVYGNADFLGNGIASTHTILSHSNQTCLSCPGEKRSLLQCRLDGNHPFIQDRSFAVTHLSHLDEDDRLKQLKDFDPHKQYIDILMADLNALTREDYSDHYYQNEIVNIRHNSQWEKARFDLTKLITDQWNYQDAFKLINPQMKDEQVATCHYGTRIDYIYVHPRVNDQWKLRKCQIINTQGATDHNAVLAEFELISQ